MKGRNRNGMLICTVGLIFCLAGFLSGQLPGLPKIPKGVTDKIPDLSRITEGEPPITSSIEDAVTAVSFLDDFDPPVFTPMTVLPRTTQGAFVLERPGLYAFTAKSYCLKAGTYAPTTGDGYILAPLAGPRSDPVRKLLHATYTHPDITQREIQVLLWAIIARTKISDMPRAYQVTAAKVLSPKDIFELNNGALGLIPEDMMDKAFEGVPPAVRTILEAEARLRQKMTQGEASYEELEEVAVRFGAAPAGEDDKYIPWGRWSFHPDGYFIRFLPRGYTRNNIQVYVPRGCLIEKDNLGRITAVCDRNTRRIEIEYAENPNPLTIAGDPQVKAYKFKKIRFINRMTIPPEMTTELVALWENTGYALVGTPSGKGKPSYNATFPGIDERYKKANACAEDIDRIDGQLKIQGSTSDLINLAHLRYALLDIMDNDRSDKYRWARYHVDLVSRVWQYEFSRRAGTFVWGQTTDGADNNLFKVLLGYITRSFQPWSMADAAGNGKPTLDNTGNTSMPGSTGKQRGGNSNAGEADPCAQVQQALDFAKAVRDAYKNVDPSKYSNGDEYNDAVIDELNNTLNKNGQASADPSSQQNAPMGTHQTNCDLAPGGTSSAYDGDWNIYDNSTTQMFEDHIKNTYFNNGPDILWRGARAHEQSHMNTCSDKTSGGNRDGYKDYMDDPANRQRDEIAAYDAQIAKLQAWLDWNCK
ncbi:MAG: hypothetical protein JSU64_05180 [candidate division WOR-3 bacterium]|nr:MAG: hypothetical protein JSU64_05180 [candidate division WOR-3 bacterium]